MAVLEVFARLFAQFLAFLGQVAALAGETILSIGAGRIRPKLVIQQIAEIGYRSQLVVIVTGGFTGAVFTAQAFFQFDALNMETAVGPVVALSMFRELGPTLAGVMVAHVLYPEVDDVPASASTRWIRGVLRGDLGFQGVVFADDLSMAGAAAVGGIAERASRALAAGCDVLPVCNHRPSVVALLDRWQAEIGRAHV